MKKYLIYIGVLSTLLTSCDNYVDIKTEGKLIPEETVNYRYLLQGASTFNYTYGLVDVASDDIVMRDDHAAYFDKYYSGSAYYKPYVQTYKWADEIIPVGERDSDMNSLYSSLYTCNVIISEVMTSKNGTDAERLAIKGEAQVHRAYIFLSLINVFGKAYDPATAATDLGIPLLTTPTVTENITRASVKEVYDLIVKDLTEAIASGLKPVNSGRSVWFPSKASAYALLARTNLYMGNYQEALQNAEAALALQNNLLNLEDYQTTGDYSWPRTFQDTENILAKESNTYMYAPTVLSLSDELLNSFDTKDLRYQLYTRSLNTMTYGSLPQGRAYSKEFLSGDGRNAGPTVPEMYVIKAECEARAGNAGAAMTTINTLRKKRFKAADYTDLIAVDANDALIKVLAERRKELMGRGGFRWADLKRLNKDPRFAKTITHTYLDQTYTIEPGGNRYQFPFATIYFDYAPDLKQNN
ncbi:RagB/SusD family nutrient uptake outer membrane protein [Flavobacterium sp. ANB]|uniref:RagB/SusD family nutrient uptake outer membrane protein n=1 Tax=unclassified Flavobacterium TaxID=196869 RepID=UPI0012B6B1F9|nr:MULTISPECIES: RagB/SusD family nutrient uptake outer membrane protein [unclassified Flavobacterium]MBF4516859.1 RagB/SusD family nutrient uptake outer membrane protein [Flavobacterium sp. ANB]MTD69245.1 RagB/SusD family nutrient uptake outer membrane protein [Flavobacterium sp. LC2016-13]